MASKISSPSSHNPSAEVKPPKMILIPGGDFIMGTSDEQIEMLWREDWAREWHDHDLFQVEQPQHTLSLPPYEISMFPVTNTDYQVFIFDSGHRVPAEWNGFGCPSGKEMHPVVGVNWQDATDYCKWLSKRTRLQFRLPTEAEWELAARGLDGRMYPWGVTFDPWRCNTSESGKRGTTPVDNYLPGGESPYGVADMVGNTTEWTSTSFKPYPYDPTDGREDHSGIELVTIRGGGWYYSHKLARCPAREGSNPRYHSSTLGFRVARNLP